MYKRAETFHLMFTLPAFTCQPSVRMLINSNSIYGCWQIISKAELTETLDRISIDFCLFNLTAARPDWMFVFCFLFYSASLRLSAPLSLSLSMSHNPLQLFKEELTQVKEGMKHINDLAHQLAISDVHLSMENARALEHLNSRWKVLQVEFTAGSAQPVWHCQRQLQIQGRH